MKKLILKILLVVDVLAFVAYFVCAEFLIKYDTRTGVVYDGFGRMLTEAPAVFSAAGLFKEWAGLGWLVVDTAASFILLYLAYVLYKAATKK